MTQKRYTQIVTVICLLFIAIFLVNQFIIDSHFARFATMNGMLLFLLEFALALCILFCGLYTRKAGLKPSLKSHKPTGLMIGGGLFAFLCVVQIIILIVLWHEHRVFPMPKVELQKTKAMAIDKDIVSSVRSMAARRYFRQTGIRIQFFDNNDQISIYVPSPKDKREYESCQSLIWFSALIKKRLTVAIISICGLLVIFGVTYLFLSMRLNESGMLLRK